MFYIPILNFDIFLTIICMACSCSEQTVQLQVEIKHACQEEARSKAEQRKKKLILLSW
jgi:hypothetical protein